MYQQYADQNFIIITLFDTMNLSDTAAWADKYGLSHPVVIDYTAEIAGRFEENQAVPSYSLLLPGLEVAFRDQSTISTADIAPYFE